MTPISHKYTLLVCLSFSLIFSACGVPQTPVTTPTLTPVHPIPIATVIPVVTIPGSELRTLKSSNTGRDYDIYVQLPANYTEETWKNYPVLYVLDGQWDFKLLDSIYGGLLYDDYIPEIIIIGITYSGPNPDYDVLRAMDYTPVAVNFLPGSGDAPKFHTFLKEELIPFIESTYRADSSNRILMGSSYGGLFTLYALFTEPELFTGYVSASPAVPYGSQFIRKQESEYFSKRQDLPVRLFISVGDQEELFEPVKAFAQALTERDYNGLLIQSMIIEGERHAGNKPEAYNRGLRFIFQGK